MIKSIVGFLFIVHPVAVASLFFMYNLEYFWYFSENYKIYDLIYSLFSFIVFIIGVRLLSNSSNLTLLILITTLFIIYQAVGWRFNTIRTVSGIALNQSYSIQLIPHGGGAFTSTSFTNLVLVEKKYLFFIVKDKKIKSYDNIYSGKLTLKNDGLVAVKLVTFSKEEVSDSINIKDLLNEETH
jgi:hypothetical protein